MHLYVFMPIFIAFYCRNLLLNKNNMLQLIYGKLKQGGLPSLRREFPPDERKGGCIMVTYEDLFQFCILMVALVSLCYQIFRDKRN